MNIASGSTGVIKLVKILDTSKNDGSGLTGLTNSTCGTLYYKRSNASGSVQCATINSGTLGTWAGHATNVEFVQVDATNMPGVYELHLPNNAFTSGAREVVFTLKGGTNAAPVDFVVSVDPQVVLGATGLNAVVPAKPAAAFGSRSTWNAAECLWSASRFPFVNRTQDDQSGKVVSTYDDSGTLWGSATYTGTAGGTINKPALS